MKETTRESQLQRCSIDGGLVERLHFASLQGNIYHNYMKSTSYEVYYISRGAGHLWKLLWFRNFGQPTCIVLYWLPYLLGKGNNSFYTVFEQTKCKINNNHFHLRFFYMFRPLKGHNQEGIHKGIQVQQILSKICFCRFKIFYTCVHLFIPPWWWPCRGRNM